MSDRSVRQSVSRSSNRWIYRRLQIPTLVNLGLALSILNLYVDLMDEPGRLSPPMLPSRISPNPRPNSKPGTPRPTQNLHILLAFSPIGDAFRDRLRKFPSLINCCAIDWFTAWPQDALVAVAKKFLSDVKFESEAHRQAVEDMCQGFHISATDLSEQFMSQLRRRTYVTPTSYLEVILAFKLSLAKRR